MKNSLVYKGKKKKTMQRWPGPKDLLMKGHGFWGEKNLPAKGSHPFSSDHISNKRGKTLKMVVDSLGDGALTILNTPIARGVPWAEPRGRKSASP